MAYRRVAKSEVIECSIPRSNLKELFDIFDLEKSGFVDARELKAALRAFGCEASAEQIRDGLSRIGHDISSPISFEVFCAMIEPNLPKRDSIENYQNLFRSIGGHLSGFITVHHLRQICDELNEPVTDEELQIMIDEADLNGDGKVTFDDFARMMKISRDPLADLT